METLVVRFVAHRRAADFIEDLEVVLFEKETSRTGHSYDDRSFSEKGNNL
jgi:hypothetical protein